MLFNYSIYVKPNNEDYKSDVIFLQECDFDFYEIDLKLNMNDEYCLQFKAKSESSRCGECILFRHRLFKYYRYWSATDFFTNVILVSSDIRNGHFSGIS